MAGLIAKESITEVRERARLDEIVSQYVQLRSSGADAFTGLCPFHDERTPSFSVRPSAGYYHCFGCGVGGDVIKFVQEIEHIGFVEAVELLAQKSGIILKYTEGEAPQERRGPSKTRLIDAHRVAVEFYEEQLRTEEAAQGLQMLFDRGFDEEAMSAYHIGYSPQGWDKLYGHLRQRGFSDEDIVTAGLGTRGTRGVYDRFRGRLMWPIYSITGDPIGFGARKLNDEDQGPKYLNTSETPIYRKSHVLYGLNLAKKSISSEKKVVIVEGYTDVMAAHLAGIPYAVATCGTAFGSDHVRIIRRLLGDSQNPAAGLMLSGGKAYGGEVIFTFDGDKAGQKAAMKAFSEDQSFAAQTFVCIAPEGKDPCEIRMAHGDEGVRQLIQSRQPLFRFVIRTILSDIPLETAEGRAAGLRATAPIVASVRDKILRGEYVRELASWLGMDEETVRAAVTASKRNLPARTSPHASDTPQTPQTAQQLTPLARLRDPIERLEREALGIYLQFPWHASECGMDQLPQQTFTLPIHQRIHETIRATGGTACYTQRLQELAQNYPGDEHEDTRRNNAASFYIQSILDNADITLKPAITQIAVEQLPEKRIEHLGRYAWTTLAALVQQGITRQIADLRSQLQRTDSRDEKYKELFARLIQLEEQKRTWDTQLS